MTENGSGTGMRGDISFDFPFFHWQSLFPFSGMFFAFYSPLFPPFFPFFPPGSSSHSTASFRAHTVLRFSGVSLAWWIKSSISAVFLTHLSYSAMVGGVLSQQCRGMHNLAALIRWRTRDLLYATWGIELWWRRYCAGVKPVAVMLVVRQCIFFQKGTIIGQSHHISSGVPCAVLHLQQRG